MHDADDGVTIREGDGAIYPKDDAFVSPKSKLRFTIVKKPTSSRTTPVEVTNQGNDQDDHTYDEDEAGDDYDGGEGDADYVEYDEETQQDYDYDGEEYDEGDDYEEEEAYDEDAQEGVEDVDEQAGEDYGGEEICQFCCDAHPSDKCPIMSDCGTPQFEGDGPTGGSSNAKTVEEEEKRQAALKQISAFNKPFGGGSTQSIPASVSLDHEPVIKPSNVKLKRRPTLNPKAASFTPASTANPTPDISASTVSSAVVDNQEEKGRKDQKDKRGKGSNGGTSTMHNPGMSASQAQARADRFADTPISDQISSRNSATKKTDINADIIYRDSAAGALVGKCLDMCPEVERYEREKWKDLSIFEQLDSNAYPPTVDHARAVKKYKRAAAAQALDPNWVRPPHVLVRTMKYLADEIVDQEPFIAMYDFVSDRFRAVRQDFVCQDQRDLRCVTAFETMLRFHISIIHELSYVESLEEHNPTINLSKLTQTLTSLTHFYEDAQSRGEARPAEAECQAYRLLIYMYDQTKFQAQMTEMSPEVQRSKDVQFAKQVYEAMKQRNYVRFFRLLRQATYLQACCMHSFFNRVRQDSARVMMKSFLSYPLRELVEILCFEDEEEARDFYMYHGVPVKTSNGESSVMFDVARKNGSWIEPSEKFPRCLSRIITAARPATMRDTIVKHSTASLEVQVFEDSSIPVHTPSPAFQRSIPKRRVVTPGYEVPEVSFSLKCDICGEAHDSDACPTLSAKTSFEPAPAKANFSLSFASKPSDLKQVVSTDNQEWPALPSRQGGSSSDLISKESSRSQFIEPKIQPFSSSQVQLPPMAPAVTTTEKNRKKEGPDTASLDMLERQLSQKFRRATLRRLWSTWRQAARTRARQMHTMLERAKNMHAATIRRRALAIWKLSHKTHARRQMHRENARRFGQVKWFLKWHALWMYRKQQSSLLERIKDSLFNPLEEGHSAINASFSTPSDKLKLMGLNSVTPRWSDVTRSKEVHTPPPYWRQSLSQAEKLRQMHTTLWSPFKMDAFVLNHLRIRNPKFEHWFFNLLVSVHEPFFQNAAQMQAHRHLFNQDGFAGTACRWLLRKLSQQEETEKRTSPDIFKDRVSYRGQANLSSFVRIASAPGAVQRGLQVGTCRTSFLFTHFNFMFV